MDQCSWHSSGFAFGKLRALVLVKINIVIHATHELMITKMERACMKSENLHTEEIEVIVETVMCSRGEQAYQFEVNEADEDC